MGGREGGKTYRRARANEVSECSPEEFIEAKPQHTQGKPSQGGAVPGFVEGVVA